MPRPLQDPQRGYLRANNCQAYTNDYSIPTAKRPWAGHAAVSGSIMLTGLGFVSLGLWEWTNFLIARRRCFVRPGTA